MNRFGFLTEDSVACFMSYAQLQASKSFPNQPDGTLVQRTLDLSFNDIQTILPNQLASRTMAAYMVENNQTCATFIKPIATNPEQT